MLSHLKSKLGSLKNDPGFLSYGILKTCHRCVYGKHYEPILQFSFSRGILAIVNYNGKTYARRGDCLGFTNCGKCLEAISNPKDFPCKWLEI